MAEYEDIPVKTDNQVEVIFLLEACFPQIPQTIDYFVFGREYIVAEKSGVEGQSVYAIGKLEDIKAYFKSCGGVVWTTTNPMFGQWKKEVV